MGEWVERVLCQENMYPAYVCHLTDGLYVALKPMGADETTYTASINCVVPSIYIAHTIKTGSLDAAKKKALVWAEKEICELRKRLVAADTELCRCMPPVSYTAEELQQLPLHQWVWIEIMQPILDFPDRASSYYTKCADAIDGEFLCNGWPGMQYSFPYEEYNSTWRAYRRNPGEEMY